MLPNRQPTARRSLDDVVQEYTESLRQAVENYEASIPQISDNLDEFIFPFFAAPALQAEGLYYDDYVKMFQR